MRFASHDHARDIVGKRGLAIVDVLEPDDREVDESITQQVLERVELADQVEEAQKQVDAGSRTGETGHVQGVVQIVQGDHAGRLPDAPEKP